MYQPHSDATTPFLIHGSEATLIRIGLKCVLQRHALREAGILRSVPRITTFSERHFDRGEFSSDQQAVITRAPDKTPIVNGRSKRVRLDAIEIAACLFAVRVAGMLLRHGHLQAWQPGLPVTIRRLVRKLEIHRKRAKRAYIKRYGTPVFGEVSRRWRRFSRWVRANLLYCACGRTLLPGGRCRRRRFREQLIRDWVEVIRQEFPDFHRVAADENELRDLVMRAFRSAARARRTVGFPTMQRNPDFVRNRVYDFIARHCTRAEIISSEGDEFKFTN